MGIQWRLRHMMADRRINNKQLAEHIGKHPSSVGHLKKYDTMPRLDEGLLESLCRALNCDISDLLVLVDDDAA